MGMDVYGSQPTSETGEYFRNNIWWWRPLWNYCEEIGKEIIPSDNDGHTNDGWGLDAAGATKLAALLQEEVDSGRCLEYAEGYEQDRRHTPKETCEYCGGTGVRTDEVGVEHGMPAKKVEDPQSPRYGQTGTCNGCNGEGTKLPFSASYPFSVDNVKEFIAFLKDSGGFSIC